MSTNVIAPTRRYRITRGKGTNYKTADYTSAENRAKAAQKWADHDDELVLCFLWDQSHSQDDLNRGWALDKVVHPRITVSLHIENYYAGYGEVVTTVTDVKMPPPPVDRDQPGFDDQYPTTGRRTTSSATPGPGDTRATPCTTSESPRAATRRWSAASLPSATDAPRLRDRPGRHNHLPRQRERLPCPHPHGQRRHLST